MSEQTNGSIDSGAYKTLVLEGDRGALVTVQAQSDHAYVYWSVLHGGEVIVTLSTGHTVDVMLSPESAGRIGALLVDVAADAIKVRDEHTPFCHVDNYEAYKACALCDRDRDETMARREVEVSA